MQIDNITVNFQDKYYMFYDWTNFDEIKVLKKVKVFKVSSKFLNDALNSKIQIKNTNFECKEAIFTDSYSYIALCFNEEKITILKSSLKLCDEERINKYLLNVKETNFDYEILSEDDLYEELRINHLIKEKINEEFTKLIGNKDFFKLNYLYYEWFNKKDSLSQMQKNIQNKLNCPLSSKELYIYDLIKKSYKTV